MDLRIPPFFGLDTKLSKDNRVIAIVGSKMDGGIKYKVRREIEGKYYDKWEDSSDVTNTKLLLQYIRKQNPPSLNEMQAIEVTELPETHIPDNKTIKIKRVFKENNVTKVEYAIGDDPTTHLELFDRLKAKYSNELIAYFESNLSV